MNARKHWLIRLALSLAFGIAVAWVSLYLTLGGAESPDFTSHRQFTRHYLKNAAQSLQNYKAQYGNFPNDLERANLRTHDSWGHPLVYSLSDGQPLIESLGRDGKRGGVGLDADLSNSNLYPIAGRVSFWKRLLDPLVQGVIIASVICGIIGAALVYAGLRKQTFETRNWLALGISLALALAMAIFGAATIALVHIPSGH